MKDLLAGKIDAYLPGWSETLTPTMTTTIRQHDTLALVDSPGSVVYYLSFNLSDGPTQSSNLRHRLAAAIDRMALVKEVLAGHGDPCAAWAAPAVSCWPRGKPMPPVLPNPGFTPRKGSPLRFILQATDPLSCQTASALAARFRKSGMGISIRTLSEPAYRAALSNGDFDIRIERTWGLPYDPYISLVARFLPPPGQPSAASNRYFGVHPELQALVLKATQVADQEQRLVLYKEIQDLMTSKALILPLFTPRRFAIVPKGKALKLTPNLYNLDWAPILRWRLR